MCADHRRAAQHAPAHVYLQILLNHDVHYLFERVQITNGLRYMHQHRIMHRDIKPANVLVGANGALKLGDLGLGRQLSEQTMEAFSKV